MAKKKGSGLSDKEVEKIRKALSEKEDKSSLAADRARTAKASGGVKAGIKEYFNTKKLERIASGKKSNRADFFRGAGFEGLGDIVDKFFEKSASEEEQAGAKKELGIDKKTKTVAGGGFSVSTSKQLLKRFKVVSDNVAAIRKDVEYIKDRVSPKEFDAKAEGKGKEGKTQRVQYDPFAPEGEKFRQVSSKGKLSTLKVGKEFHKSATMQAAMISKPKPLPKMTGTLKAPKKMAAAAATGVISKPKAFSDPVEKSPFDNDLKTALAGDPMQGISKQLKIMDAKLDKILDGGGGGGGLLDMVGSLKGLLPIMKTVGSVLGPMAAVGAAAFIGYQIGGWLEKEFKLGDKIAGAVDTVAGWFGGGTKGAAKEAADKAGADLSSKRNAGLKGTGWQYVVKAGAGTEPSDIYFLDPKGARVAVKDAPDDVREKAGLAKAGNKPAKEVSPDKALEASMKPAATAAPAAAAAPAAPPAAAPPPAAAAPPSGGGGGSLPSKPPAAAQSVGGSVPTGVLGKASEKKKEDSGLMGVIRGAMQEAGLINEFGQIALLANIKKETNFKLAPENLNYTSIDRIRKVFPGMTKNLSDEEIGSKYVKNPEALAELVYGYQSKLGPGMGNSAPGDGWKYRGRGFIQLTGKSNYERYGKMVGVDLVKDPDLANDPVVAAKIAARFVMTGLKNKLDFTSQSDANRAVTQTIGGKGLNLNAGIGAELLAKVDSYSSGFSGGGGSFGGGGATGSWSPSGGGSSGSSAPVSSAPSAGSVASTGSATPTASSSGAALDSGSKQVAASKEAAAAPPAPVVVASHTTPNSASKTPPQAAHAPKAGARPSEGSFNRALAKDYSHPTAFTTVGTV